ncbi:MAG: pantetheine-phosphate adenylyltransferase [Clostridia bacterium]|nr:pantetheine-phosphate adenylyltransferase [Clostridia bacterium]
MSTCLFPGSFDPPTVGHIDIIRRASALFDHVYVAVMVNTAKTPFCPIEERLDMLRTCCRGLKNVTVLEGRGMTVDLAKACGADALLRGVRGEADGGQEAAMAALNARIGGIDTVALFTAPEYSFVSSTFARDVIHYGGKLEGILPKEIIPRFKNRG